MRNSNVVFEDNYNSKYSRLAVSFDKLAQSIPESPTGLYGHVITLQIGGLTITSNQLDFEFEIPFDDDTEANECEFHVFNMSDNSVNTIQTGSVISISAGHKNDTGVIFKGFVSKVITRKDGVDKVTTIYALDSQELKERDIENLTFKSGSNASTILRTLVDKVGLPVAVFNLKRDYTYKDAVTIDGGLMDNIKKYAQVCGVSAYICKSNIYVRAISDGDNANFVLNSNTGLISVKEWEEEQTAEQYKDMTTGVEIEMLLQHRIQTASIVNLESENFKGVYRVREGSHSYDGVNLLTKVKCIGNVSTEIIEEKTSKKTGSSGSSSRSRITQQKERETPLKGIMHVCTKTDTIEGICERYGIGKEEIALYNNFPADTVSEGQILIVG